MVIRAGRLRHEVIIQEVTQTRDTSGSVTESWSTTDTVRAEIKPIKSAGSERFIHEQVMSVGTHMVTIRYQGDVTPKHRILWGSRIFDINDVRDDYEKNRTMELICTEKVS